MNKEIYQKCIVNDIEDLKEFGEIQIFKTKHETTSKEFLDNYFEDLNSIGFNNFKMLFKMVPAHFSFQKQKKSDTIVVAFKDSTAKFMFNLILRK